MTGRVMTARLARSTPVDACFELLRLLSRRVCDEGVEKVDGEPECVDGNGGPQDVQQMQIQEYLMRQGIDLRTEFSEHFSRAQPALFVTAPWGMSFGEMEGFVAPQCIAAYNDRFAASGGGGGGGGGGGHSLLPTDRRRLTICLDWMFKPYNLYKSWTEYEKGNRLLDTYEEYGKLRDAPVHCGLAHTALLEVDESNFISDLCFRRTAGGETGLLESVRRGEDPALDLRLGPAAPRTFGDLETSRCEEAEEKDMVEAFGSVEACRAAVDEMRRRLGPK